MFTTGELHRSTPSSSFPWEFEENIPVLRVSTHGTGVLYQWRVSGVEDYDSGTVNPKVVYLTPPFCVCKSDNVERHIKRISLFYIIDGHNCKTKSSTLNDIKNTYLTINTNIVERLKLTHTDRRSLDRKSVSVQSPKHLDSPNLRIISAVTLFRRTLRPTASSFSDTNPRSRKRRVSRCSVSTVGRHSRPLNP